MKKALWIALALAATTLASQALVGIKYRGEVRMEGGPRAQNAKSMTPEEKEMARKLGLPTEEGAAGFQFEAVADDGKFKMTYLTDFILFPKGSYILGDGKAKVAYFVFPDRREYVEMNVDEMQAGAQQMVKSMKVSYANQRVDVSPLPPKVVSGTPCTGKRIKISHDMQTTVMGFKTKSHTEQVTDYYSTTAYDVLAIFGERNWHNQGLSIGDPDFDKVIAAKVGFLGFPMEVRTQRFDDGKDQGTTILTTRDVQMVPVPPGTFTLPSGYTRTELGLGSMMKGLAQANEEGNARDRGQVQGGEEEPENPPSGDNGQKKKPSLKDILKGLGK
ncbi:MAG: hypothetical protein ACP5VN_01235 [Acidobacteriota bacterium]